MFRILRFGFIQAALRRTMEKESKTTRFCLICNYISRIIQPITSRCSKFRFKPLSQEILKQRIEYICSQEKVEYDPDVNLLNLNMKQFVLKLISLIHFQMIPTLVACSEGDLRKAITYLQCAARLRQNSGPIKSTDILDIAGVRSH